MTLFPDFTLETVALPAGPVRLRRGGAGPPLVCLHGNPQTHMMWHAVAPALAQRFTVYCPDLRGYGTSPKPGYAPDHAPYTKREMARDVTALMDHFGHERFTLVTHDRGARTAHRLALDAPQRVERLAVMDIVPTLEHFERTDMLFALAYAHWFYLAMPAPFPEQMIENDPVGWFRGHTRRGNEDGGLFHPEAEADYLAALSDREVVRGICEDYRAAASTDLEHDRASRVAGARIQCPLLVLWGDAGIIGRFYDPLAIWSDYAAGPVTGGAVPSGHYLPEEAPAEVLEALWEFLD